LARALWIASTKNEDLVFVFIIDIIYIDGTITACSFKSNPQDNGVIKQGDSNFLNKEYM